MTQTNCTAIDTIPATSAGDTIDKLHKAGLVVGPGTLTTPDGRTYVHNKIVWTDTGGLVWHGSLRHRCVSVA